MRVNYNDYQQKEALASKDYSNLPSIRFASEFLKKDGDYLVVRFPYHTEEDFFIEHCHEVNVPGYAYPQKVECTKDTGDCPLCGKEGVKDVTRFLVLMVGYVVKDGKVELVPVVWDRPYGYATELKGKMDEYGDLTEHLFKIKRNGIGQNTTYSTDVILNTTVYKPEIYVKDFSVVENTQVDKILVRRMSKYLELIGENADPAPVPSTTPDTGDASDIFHPETSKADADGVIQEKPTPTNPAMNRPKRYQYN